ncbi:hypothetical protein DICA0_F02740 [Diutina catenulata]
MSIAFGHKFRETYYKGLDAGVYPVNHGSYGLTPDPNYEAFNAAMKYDYSYPDRYLRIEHFGVYEKSLKAIGKFVNADHHRLALVENATTGVNTILRSWPFEKGDRIVIATTSYGACANTVKYLENRSGIVPVIVELNYPLSDDEVITKFEDSFKEHKPTLAMFDAISSMPGARVPFERLVKLCKQYSVLSLVDGAHSIGMIPLSLDNLGADFYVTNCHKWLGVPRGCAVLYIDPQHWHHVHTMPVSHSYLDDTVQLPPAKERNRIVDRFGFIGTTNFASYATIPAAIKFREDVGGEDAIREYCFNLAHKIGELVSQKWGTSVLENENGSLTTAMVTVEVPISDLGVSAAELEANFATLIDFSAERMMYHYNTFVPWIIHNNKCWARFSAQIYTELSDFDYASDVLIKALRESIHKLQDPEVVIV